MARNGLSIAVLLIAWATGVAAWADGAKPLLSPEDADALAFVRRIHGDAWGRLPPPGRGNEPPLHSRLWLMVRREELAIADLVVRREAAGDPDYVGLNAAIQLRQLARLCFDRAGRDRGNEPKWAAYAVRGAKLSRLATLLTPLLEQSAKSFHKAETGGDGSDAARRQINAMLALPAAADWWRSTQKQDIVELNVLAERLAPIAMALVSEDGRPVPAQRHAVALPAAPAARPSAKPATAADARRLAEQVRAGKLPDPLAAELLRQLGILELLLDQDATRAAAGELLATVLRVHAMAVRIAALAGAGERMKSLLLDQLALAAARFGARETREDGLARLDRLEQSLEQHALLDAVAAAAPEVAKALAAKLETALVLLTTEDTREKGGRQAGRLWRIVEAVSRTCSAADRAKRGAALPLGGFCRLAVEAADAQARAAMDLAVAEDKPDAPKPADGKEPPKTNEQQWQDAIGHLDKLAADAAAVQVLLASIAAVGRDPEAGPRNASALMTAVGIESRRLLREDSADSARRSFSEATAIALAIARVAAARTDDALESAARSLGGAAYGRSASQACRAARALIEDFAKTRGSDHDLAAKAVATFANLREALRGAAACRDGAEAISKVNKLRTYQFAPGDVNDAYKAVVDGARSRLEEPLQQLDPLAADDLAGAGRVLAYLAWVLQHDGAADCKEDSTVRMAAGACLPVDEKNEAESLRMQLGAYVNEGLQRILENDLRQASRYGEPTEAVFAKLRAAVGE